MTYAEELQNAGIDWRCPSGIRQLRGDNGLAYFKNFRKPGKA